VVTQFGKGNTFCRTLFQITKASFYVVKSNAVKTLSKGTVILNSSNLINNRDPRFFDNPDVFEPERWLDQQQRNKAKFATVGSFGSGATMCPGRKFALQELHCLVIALLQRYRLEYHYKPIKMKFRAVSIASEKPRFKFVRLWASSLKMNLVSRSFINLYKYV